MKRKLAILLTAVMAATTLQAGFAASAAADEAGADLVWWGWTPGSPINESFIEAFNEQYPDINITWKQVAIDDYDATIKPALANGEGVDLFEVSAGSANGGVSIFGSMAVEMTPYLVETLGEDYADKLSESSLSSMTVDGELKALGVGTVYAGNLWINKDLFDEYDVAIPTNFDEWKAACEAFAEHDIIGFVQGAGQGAFNIDMYHAICDNVSPGEFTKALRGEAEWTDETFVTAFEIWKRIFDEGIMQDGALGIQQYPEANNLFLSQQAAMVMMGSWYTMNTLPDTMRANMESASSTDDPFTMIPINFPDVAGTGNVGSMFNDIDYAMAVAQNASDVDAAAKFAVWLGATEEGQQLIADSLNVVPVLKSATPNWDEVQLVNPEAQNEAVKAYLENAMNNPDNPRFGEISADLNQAMMDVLAGVASGTMSPEDAAQELVDAAEW